MSVEEWAMRIAQMHPVTLFKDWSICKFCDRDLEAMYAVKGSIEDPGAHEPDCPWMNLRLELGLTKARGAHKE